MDIPKTDTIELSDFVHIIAARMQQNKLGLRLAREKLWQILFYQLGDAEESTQRPEFFSELYFEGTPSYPRSRKLSACLRGLRRIESAAGLDPWSEENYLPPEICDEWAKTYKEYDPEIQKFIDFTLERARDVFPAKANDRPAHPA